MGLVRTLVDRVYKTNNSWLGFHKDTKNLIPILRKNLFPVHIVEKVINRYLSRAKIRPSASSQVRQTVSTFYFKLPYVGSFTREAQKRLRKLVQRYCTNIEIKLAFSSMFSVRDPIPVDLRSRVVYKFSCAGCNACYIREIELDVTWSYVKRQTAKLKLLPSVFSSLNSRVKIFVFVANSTRH